MAERSLQELYAPENRCFGCGPSNDQGLRIRSFARSDAADAEVVCAWQPQEHHQAFGNILNDEQIELIIGYLREVQESG